MSSFIDTEAKRKAIQARLIELGYSCGPDGADGVLGGDTSTAVIAFRVANDLSPEPVIDAAFMAKLNPAPVPAFNLSTLIGLVGPIASLLKGKSMTQDQIGGIVRAVIAAASGYFVGKGLIDANTAATIGGAIGTILIAVWSYWTNRPSKLAK